MKKREWGYQAVLLLACAHFTLSYVAGRIPLFSMTDYASGRVGGPFQYRILCAWIIRWMMHLPHWNEIAARSQFFTPDKLAVAVIVFPSIVGAVWFTERTGKALMGNGILAAALLLYMAYFAVDLNYTLAFLEPYDVPALFFFAAMVYALVTDRPWLFVLAFLVGTLNRETTILLLPLLLVWRWRWTALALAASWAVEMFLIHWSVRGHSAFYLRLSYNLRELVKPHMWPALASVFGFLWPLFLLRFEDIDRRLARGTLAVLILWIFGMLLVGNLNEVRVFTEPIALMAPCIAMLIGPWASRFDHAQGLD